MSLVAKVEQISIRSFFSNIAWSINRSFFIFWKVNLPVTRVKCVYVLE
jgi:hypothetical protein